MRSSVVAPEETDELPFNDVRPFNENHLTTKANSTIIIPRPTDYKVSSILFNNIEVWERYESAYCAFVSNGVYKATLKKQFVEDDIGKNMQNTIVDYSTAYALQGSAYVEEIQMNLQYTVLQSALVLTISMPLYIEPPELKTDTQLRIFSAVIGLAAFLQLITIIGCTIISGLLNRAYAGADAMVARVKAQVPMVSVNIWNYLANVATILAMLIAGFSRSTLDGAVHMYVALLAVVLLALFAGTFSQGNKMQDMRSYEFYVQFCDPNTGRLKEEYLKKVYLKRRQILSKVTDKIEKMNCINENPY